MEPCLSYRKDKWKDKCAHILHLGKHVHMNALIFGTIFEKIKQYRENESALFSLLSKEMLIPISVIFMLPKFKYM